ncbi:MAG: UDP-N-acetylmuramoyl-tripeptide--D-alanyl-D-alanine ligase [Deltaproteobacteria bacterium]|jgi:UDP-N-acetylmuramoyl-tripeptide--D-alanyl-D-alanine ligase|nr:UDP-N-acetylmuramoyl-tripeptide--D-alanyl-D-alanine ligase [Deltaproteobacteria bacterium]
MATGLRLSDALLYAHGQWVGPEPKEEVVFSGVSSDSRTIGPGELFVAIKGKNFDGNDYVEAALAAGAGAAISDRPGWAGRPVIEVKNGLKALGDLARGVRRSHGFKVLALTGSVGKTTVKEMAKHILQARGRSFQPERPVLATQGNLNNEVGLPLSILEVLKSPRAPMDAVLEMGASAPGDIDLLTDIARPDVGLITALGPAHLEFFKDYPSLVKTKAELIWRMYPGSTAVINKADQDLRAALEGRDMNWLYYGPGGQIFLRKIQPQGLTGQRLTFGGFMVDNLEVDLNLPGEHNAFNALAAAAAAVAMGCGKRDVRQGLSEVKPLAGRLCPVQAPGGYFVLDDSYNANPASVRSSLRLLAELVEIRPKGAILGDMLELGEVGPELHQEIGRLAADLGLDFLALVGDLAKNYQIGIRSSSNKRLREEIFSSPEEAVAWVRTWLEEGGVVMVKGSRAGGLERAVQALTQD